MCKNYIIGLGGFAKEVYCILQRNNKHVDGFIDINESTVYVQNVEYTSIKEDLFLSTYDPHDCNLYVGIGNPNVIKSIKQKYFNFTFPNLFDPDAKILGKNSYGEGNIFCCNIILTTDIKIGSFNIFNIGCTIGHDTEIHNCNVFNPTCCVSGNVKIQSNNLFGVNSTVLENIEICSNNVIGASALVSKNIIDSGIYVGIPAKRKV